MDKKEQLMTKTVVVWLGALLCCALWGSAFPCIKIGYRLLEIPSEATATQILFAGCRFTLAGVLAIAIGSVVNRKPLVPGRSAWGKIVKLCSLQTVAQYIFFYIGLANTSGVKASIVEGMNVFVAIFIACVLFHQERMSARKVIGCIIGFAGVVLVNITGGVDMSFTFTGDGFIFLSTVAYAFSSVLLKRYSVDENPVMLSGWQFAVGGLIMIVIGLLFGGCFTVINASGLAMLVYLAMVSAVAYSVWGILLKYNSVSRVTVFGFMNPVCGVILSALLLDEAGSVGLTCLVSLILVCTGIYIVNKKSS